MAMKHLTEHIAFLRSSNCGRLPLTAVCEAARWQSSSRSATNDDARVSTHFPGKETSIAIATAGHGAVSSFYSAKSDASRGRRNGRRDSGGSSNRETDGLLKDIFNLEKQVAAEQQRHRLSVCASQLGQVSVSHAADGRRSLSSPAAVEQMMAAEGVKVKEVTPAAASTVDANVTPPILSVPTAEETCAAASRARLPSGVRSVFARAASTPAAPSKASPSESQLPPPLSWSPPFAFTWECLRSPLDIAPSEVALTLEELEDTLFSPFVEAEVESRGNIISEGVTAASSTLAPPPPPPPAAPAVPSAKPFSPSVTEENVISRVASTAETNTSAVLKKGQTLRASDEPAIKADDKTSAALPSVAEPVASATASGIQVAASAIQSDTPSTGATKVPATRLSSASFPPLLKCRLRGTAVVVVASRAAFSLRELVEALSEAITFAETLPPLPSPGVREVRLCMDVPASYCTGFSFLCAREELSEVTAATEEKVRVQLMKERLLRRMQENGQERRLRFVAEVQTTSNNTTKAATPVVLRDFAAELLLSCDAHEVRHVSRLTVRLGGNSKDPVHLSFSGIRVGMFPAPTTIRRVKRLIEKVLVQYEQHARQLLESFSADVSGSTDHTSNTLLCLHLLPTSFSTLLLAARSTENNIPETDDTAGETAVVVARRNKVKLWINNLYAALSQRWVVFAQQRGGSTAAALPATEVGSEASLSACITAAQVWSWMCKTVLQADTTNTSILQDAVMRAMRAAPLLRCKRNYARATTAAPFVPTQAPMTSATTVNHNKRTLPVELVTSSPFVMEVSNSTLVQLSVADLASSIKKQPSDVVLAIESAIPLEQRLKFLASLHLADTGVHHTVTVLLAGTPQEVDECASLTRSSARLAVPVHAAYGPTTVHPCEAAWLHETVEVSVARSSCGEVSHAASRDDCTLPEMMSAVQYVTMKWHRPCSATAKSEVGAALAKAVQNAEKELLKGQASASMNAVARQQQLQQSLFPLVLLHEDVASIIKQAGVPKSASKFGVEKATSLGFGLAFLMVLNAACHVLCREATKLSTESVNVSSIAALQLDASAGGIFDAADVVCGDSVGGLVATMEAAAKTHQVEFSSLPLLRWMVEEKLLFYQLNSRALARFAKSVPSQPRGSV